MRWIVGGHAVTKQAGHMDASDLIKAVQNTLQAGGPTYGECRLS